jgi:proteasome lid subunit RPN8/RPN11
LNTTAFLGGKKCFINSNLKFTNMKSKRRPKIQILETPFNQIVNTIGSRPAESGGLLFGKEDDMIVRKFVFDKNAQTSRSTYTLNTDFLNPEIKRIHEEEGLSCLGFIHSHPYGYGRLSPPDINYFASMFDYMPRTHYITPIIFTVSDGGFKMHGFVLPNQSRDPIKADTEILPDDYFQTTDTDVPKEKFAQGHSVEYNNRKFYKFTRAAWLTWKLIIALGLSYYLIKTLITPNL